MVLATVFCTDKGLEESYFLISALFHTPSSPGIKGSLFFFFSVCLFVFGKLAGIPLSRTAGSKI